MTLRKSLSSLPLVPYDLRDLFQLQTFKNTVYAMFLNVSICLCTASIYLIICERNNVSFFFTYLFLYLDCCEDFSSLDKGATYMLLLKEKDRTMLSEIFQKEAHYHLHRLEMWEHCHEYRKKPQHIWMLNGGGHVSAEIKDNTTPEMAAKTRGLSCDWEQNRSRVSFL